MNLKRSAAGCSGFSLIPATAVGTCLFIVAAMVGLLVLSSCAHDAASHARQEHTINCISNTVSALQRDAIYLPPPANGIATIVLAGITAGLAAWNTHLHKGVKTLQNGNGNGKKAPP